MNGTIFDIQRFSVHDGPGIRTTVFMKGCPMRCRWCHNPEGLLAALQLQFFADRCIGCGSCGTRTQLSDAQKCPAQALKICGRVVNDADVLREVMKDRTFYGEDGGVTFSGGECLLQADFVAAVLSQAKACGLHTAIDTSGCVAWGEIEKTLEYCDLYLYDVKCMDPSVHRAFTGVDNMLILENLCRLSASGKKIWIRIPVIPGFNNNDQEMDAIAACLASLPAVEQVTLMPYHMLGASKYPTLGMSYPFDPAGGLTETEMNSYHSIFRGWHLL